MKLNRTPNPLDRSARNGENENWDIIEGEVRAIGDRVDNFVDEISEDAYNKLVEDARLDWREMVDEYSDLPTNARKGTTVGVKEQGIIYRYNGSSWDRLFEINLNPIAEVDDRLTSQLAESVGGGFYGESLKVNARWEHNMSINILPGTAHLPNGKVYTQSGFRVIDIPVGYIDRDRFDAIYVDESNIHIVEDYQHEGIKSDSLLMALVRVKRNATKIYGNDVFDKRNILTSNQKLLNDITKFKEFTNSDGAISSMIDTAMTYVGNPLFKYGNYKTLFDVETTPDENGKYEIDCSSFVCAALQGIKLDNSKYKNLVNYRDNNSYTRLDSSYSEQMIDGGMLANELGKFAYDNGYFYEIDGDFSKVRVGDIILFRNSPHYFFWQGIGHVGIVSRIGQNDTLSIIEAIDGQAYTVNVRDFTYSQITNRGGIYGARIPLSGSSGEPVPINDVIYRNHNFTGTVIGEISLNKMLKSNQLYTLIMEIDFDNDSAYPFIRTSDGVDLYSFTSNVVKRPSNFYQTSFYISDNKLSEIGENNRSSITILRNGSGGGTLKNVKMFEGYVSYTDFKEDNSIVESGRNSNGYYVRFSDGTQMCYRFWAGSNAAPNIAVGALFKSSTQTWTFPKDFISAPAVSIDSVYTGRWGTIVSTPSNISASYEILSATSGSSVGNLSMQAIGRWR